MPVDLVVVGLGYVGMPLAQGAAQAGLSVVGYDVDEHVLDTLRAGVSHIDDLSDADVSDMNARGFSVTSDPAVFGTAATVAVCVPTPLSNSGGPDLTAVERAMHAIGANLRAGTLVILESTTYPGTTDDVVRPILEQGSGLVAGRDFNVAFSPERIDPGNPVYGLRNTPKVVGGLTEDCAARAARFYSGFVDTVVVAKGVREAETAKLLENTYRHVNIALVNELAKLCHELDIDLWDVIRLARTKPFGFQAFYPGPGVGGHCIPIDPNYLGHTVRSTLGQPFRFVELAQEVNAAMPAYVVHRAQNILNEGGLPLNGAQVLLLGVTYKADVGDQRETPALGVARQLSALGARVTYHDPLVTAWADAPAEPIDDLAAAVSTADLVILLQAHSAYDPDRLAESATRFFDTRGVATSPRAIRL